MSDEKCINCGAPAMLCVCDWKRRERKHPGDTGVPLPVSRTPVFDLVEGNVYFGKLKDGARFFGECRLRLKNMVQIGGNFRYFSLLCFGVEEVESLTDFGPLKIEDSESSWPNRMRLGQMKACRPLPSHLVPSRPR